MDEGSSEIEAEAKETESIFHFDPKVRWMIPHIVDSLTFIGKDVLAIAHDIYIMFLNLKLNTELIYLANDEFRGDGVDCIAGHKTNIFTFAEKVKNPRIFIMSYPNMVILAELKDADILRYKALCMMDCEMICAFSGFPNYAVTLWSWRVGNRLLYVPTGVVRRTQILMASRTHMLVCQCWGEGLTVWEVAQCYKRCFMMKRSKEEKTGWELSEARLVGVCWSNDGQLYAIDAEARLYSVLSDGIGMTTNLEWSDDIQGSNEPLVCSLGNGLAIYGPDNNLRYLKKAEQGKWSVASVYTCASPASQLVASVSGEAAALWTAAGELYRLNVDADRFRVALHCFKQRNIQKVQMIAPDFQHLATLDNTGVLCIYEILTAKLAAVRYMSGNDVSFSASPVDPLLCVLGTVGENYGMALFRFEPDEGLVAEHHVSLTDQIVTRVEFSATGREIQVAAMSAGHVFIYKLSTDYKLTLVRYTELGRGLADCFLMKVGEAMRAFQLVLFSDKYIMGERVICINAETGKDNRFAGKMQGPYCRLLPLSTKDTMLGIPHLSKQYHILKLNGDKGITITVKIGAILESGHDMRAYDGFITPSALLTFGSDGAIIMRTPDAPEEYQIKLAVSHRYDHGIRQAVVDDHRRVLVTLANNRDLVVQYLDGRREELQDEVTHSDIELDICNPDEDKILHILKKGEKNYLDQQEDMKVYEEKMDYRVQRAEVLKSFKLIRKQLVTLLEENIQEKPLHQLSLSEFNLHMEHRKERLKQAEKEREMIRLSTLARITAQDKVTAWIKKYCWDAMLTQRVKLYAIFSHYEVENYTVLPTQRDKWPELQQIEALRAIEMQNDADLFRPWVEPGAPEPEPATQLSPGGIADSLQVLEKETSQSRMDNELQEAEETPENSPYVLYGSNAYRFIDVSPSYVPQTIAFSFLQMNWQYQLTKLNSQNMRLWFNKQFNELMNTKKREVGLVEERNARLRFVIEELNKLSDLRGSFHHLIIAINDPQWRQEEQPQRLIKVEPEECSIEPYISPSQIVIIPPDPGPKDDFRERALMDMMDGVLEKLWHEEIKKPIPMPQCMLDKDPEHFNEDDLRLVFDYEAKVRFRNEERDKYRKMLHAEYAKLSGILNEGIVKFNQKVKEMWLRRIQVDSVIGEENLILMRLRRVNLDRVEMDEALEEMRGQIARYEVEIEGLQADLRIISAQDEACQSAYATLLAKDKFMERTFKKNFADLSSIIVDQCYKYYKKRPKWHQRATMIPVVLNDLASTVLTGVRMPLLHPDCTDFIKSMDQMDLISNMPPVMDEGLWTTMCRLRRAKIENEIKMKSIIQEMAYVDSCNTVWNKALDCRNAALVKIKDRIIQHRESVEFKHRNKTIQLVLPAGQIEIITTGHIEDYDDAALIPRDDIEVINKLILRVGAIKLKMMRKQIQFRRVILAKEWEHAQMKMKLRHMEQELYHYRRLRIPKELQRYLKEKELGYTDEQDYVRMEKEMEATKMSINRILTEVMNQAEEVEMKINTLSGPSSKLDDLIDELHVKVSEKRVNEDPFEPIRIRRVYKKRMETLVTRGRLIREVQENHMTIVLLQTELELLRLKTYPTLATFRTLF